MKRLAFLSTIICAILLINSCSDKDSANRNLDEWGKLQFQTTNSLQSNLKASTSIHSILANPNLTGDTTTTYTTSFKLTVGDIWVSTGEVKEGNSDNLEWVRLTSETNRVAKLFENYSFSEIDIPIGNYKSIKITFRNVFYRYAELADDPSVHFELLETMGSWTDSCSLTDTSWADTNFFGPDGNHVLNEDGKFELVSTGEKLNGFTIESNRKAIVSWRLFAGAQNPCTTFLIDENSNLIWDCGIDRMEFECPPDVEYMWDFLIEYQ